MCGHAGSDLLLLISELVCVIPLSRCPWSPSVQVGFDEDIEDIAFSRPYGDQVFVSQDRRISVIDLTTPDMYTSILVGCAAGSCPGNPGPGVGTRAQLYYPEGIAPTADGTALYLVDDDSDEIYKVDLLTREMTLVYDDIYDSKDVQVSPADNNILYFVDSYAIR